MGIVGPCAVVLACRRHSHFARVRLANNSGQSVLAGSRAEERGFRRSSNAGVVSSLRKSVGTPRADPNRLHNAKVCNQERAKIGSTLQSLGGSLTLVRLAMVPTT